MAKSLTPAELKQLARLGAAARILELEREIAMLRRAFPGVAASQAAVASELAPPKSRRGRKAPMSAAEKKQVSERMQKYWAQRREAKAKAAAKAAPRPKAKAKSAARSKAKGQSKPQPESQS